MHLSAPENEAAYKFIKDTIEGNIEKDKNLCWRIPTSEIYALYRRWATRHTEQIPITVEDFCDILWIEFPFAEIVGKPGNRAFTGLKKK